MTLLYEEPRQVFSPTPVATASFTADPRRGTRSRGGVWARRILSDGGIVFLVTFSAYFTVAMLLDFEYHSFQGDAIARMANGFYMIHSRDPHLAAIGFVWNPLSSIADLPLLAFNSVWPLLASHDVAGTTVSAVAMACAAYQLHALLKEWRVRTVPRLILTAFFAFNPMILYYGGNGMSEALYLFAMIAAARYLLRWLGAGDLRSLVYTAIALAIGYLERSEPLAAAMLAAPIVFFVTYRHSIAQRSQRVWAGLTDVTILLLPIVTAVVGWAAVSWVITGQSFPQFTSKYGNTHLIAESHVASGTMLSRLVHEATAITYLSPLLVVIVVAACVVALLRRNGQIIGLVAILGGGLAFTLASYLTGAIFPWFRYYIMVVPLEVLLVGSLLSIPAGARPAPAHREQAHGGRPGGRRRGAKPALVSVGVILLCVGLLLPSIPGTARAMDNYAVAPDVVKYIGFIYQKNLSPLELSAKDSYAQVQQMAAYLDDRHFSIGDVIADTANSCIPNVYTNVTDPRIFVITNDRDFQTVLADPLASHSHYLLVGFAQDGDAVLAKYPHLGRGSGWVKLVHTFLFPHGAACNGFRLFRVVGSTPGGSS